MVDEQLVVALDELDDEVRELAGDEPLSVISALQGIGVPTGSVDDAVEQWRPWRALAAAHLAARGMLLAACRDVIHVT